MRNIQHKCTYKVSSEFEYLDILEGKKTFIFTGRGYNLQAGDIIKVVNIPDDMDLLVKITYVDYSLYNDDFVCVAIKEYKE